MNSTPKAPEPQDALVARADERLAHAYQQIARADEELTRVSEQVAKMEREDAHPRSAEPAPQSPVRPNPSRNHRIRPSLVRNRRLEDRRSAPPSACCWRLASLSLPWFCSRPMAAGSGWLSPVGLRSSFQLDHCRRKIRLLPRSPRHLPLKSPQQRRYHRKRPKHRKQRVWRRPPRKAPRR
jgi:hypothetical protein